MTWVILALELVAAVGVIVLAAGWWRLQRTIEQLKRDERLKEAARRAQRDAQS